MSTYENDIFIDEALDLAATLDDIYSRGYVNTLEMYLHDGDLGSAYDYYREMKTELRAYSEVAHG